MIKRSLLTLMVITLLGQIALADPCGMVPPIYTGPGQPITRVGDQMTYVFYKDGVETFVIRPGFEGKVDEFGMLIPFPAVPALRKVPDHIFPHVQAAIDPPEVVVDLRPRPALAFSSRARSGALPQSESTSALEFKDRVVVVKQEAVGMYEVAVLEAGSAAALKRWMDDHGYVYPKGMDDVCEEYVEEGWCFVAVKTKVGQKDGVDPKPAQRNVNSKLPDGSVFDGNVQGMGFRFKSDELVVPMRLSAFNAGELHNIVYIVTDKPQKIRSIPEEYVVRQVSGEALHRNVTGPLPLRIIGGTEKDLTDWHKKSLPGRRNPTPKNGAAKELFASDLKAVASGELSLEHEEKEKELLSIGEALGLRGGEIDKLHAEATSEMSAKATAGALEGLKEMAITVVDGDFPRDVLAGKNLTFAAYNMPARRNTDEVYDSKTKKGAGKRQGVLLLGEIDWSRLERQRGQEAQGQRDVEIASVSKSHWVLGLASGGLMLAGLAFYRRSGRGRLISILVAGMIFALAGNGFAAEEDQQAGEEEKPTIRQLLNDLSHKEKAEAAVEQLIARGDEAKDQLKGEVIEGGDLTRRGWAVVALGEIGGDDIDALFKKVHEDGQQPMLVRTWCAAGRVAMVDSTEELTSLAPLVQQFPAVGRPLGMRLVEQLSGGEEASAEGLLAVSLQVSQLQSALAPAILATGADKLTVAMAQAKDQNVRRQAAAYLATLAQQGSKDDVAKAVVKQYAFDPMAKEVPWNDGPLFVPGIQWDKENAKALAGDLVKWHLWCDINSKAAEQNQIHNNIRSLGLANAAGYQSPGFQNVGTVQWLQTWGKAFGKEELQGILAEQKVEDNAKYNAALKGL